MIGDFTLFGFTPDPAGLLDQRIPQRLGIFPRRLAFGNAGALFFHSTYADMAETEEAAGIKLGVLRSIDGSPLSTKALLLGGIVSPQAVDSERMRGNALVACLSKQDPVFTVYKTVLGVPQMYYTFQEGSLICTDRLACLCELLDRVELDEALLPMHFLFRSIPGEKTYFRQIKRLLPGENLVYKNGELRLKIVQDFRFVEGSDLIHPDDKNALEFLYDSLRNVVGDYITQIEQNEGKLATLLSGGVDSSLLQHLVSKESTCTPMRSYSFAVRAPSFLHEIEYAQQASEFFKTNHTFVDIQPEDYPGLLSRAIDILAQPPILETEPGMLSIAEHSQSNNAPERYFVSGQGADTIFGLNWSKKLKALELAGKIPGAVWILRETGNMLKPFKRVSQMLLKGSEMLVCAEDQDSFLSPVNSIVVYSDPDMLRRCFGDEVLLNALRYRRELAARYLDTDHYLEKVHIVDLLTDTYELGVQRQQLFLAKEREKIHPFFDDDILRAGFSIPASERYIRGMRPKYLLKDLLYQKTEAPAAHKPKGFSIWETDLIAWMKSGPLRSMIEEINLPGFISHDDYTRLLDIPDYFLWGLLTYDIFQKHVAGRQPVRELVG